MVEGLAAASLLKYHPNLTAVTNPSAKLVNYCKYPIRKPMSSSAQLPADITITFFLILYNKLIELNILKEYLKCLS